MKLKLDEDLGRRPAELLRQAGHDVSTAREEGLRGAPDRTVIDTCRHEGRCLVTLDLDFGDPLLFTPSEYSGTAVLRLPPKTTPQDLYDTVQTPIVGLEKERIEGKLWIVQRGRIRLYQQGQETEDD